MCLIFLICYHVQLCSDNLTLININQPTAIKGKFEERESQISLSLCRVQVK